MNPLERIKNFLETKEPEMILMLEGLVNQESGTGYKEGVDLVGEKLSILFKSLGYQVEVIEQKEHGNHLIVRSKPSEKQKVLLLGHMDTVFPKGTVKENPFTIKENRAYGPGVNDMKAGLVSIYWALRTIKELGLDEEIPSITIIFNSDEEVGSPSSRSIIEKEAKSASYALVLEAARANGAVVTARKGVGRYTLYSKGKAAHAGVEPEKGCSAIVDLAEAILEIHNLNDFERGTTFNIGVIEGGIAPNVVPESASAKIDLRLVTLEEATKAEKLLRKVAEKPYINGATRVLEGGINRPPMEKTERMEELYKKAHDLALQLGFELPEAMTGGGSDGNFTAALGVPTLDGLGPVGGDDHSTREYIDIKTLVPRTSLLAALILRLDKLQLS